MSVPSKLAKTPSWLELIPLDSKYKTVVPFCSKDIPPDSGAWELVI